MTNSTEMFNDDNNMQTLLASLPAPLAEPTIGSEVKTTEGDQIWEKSPEKAEAAAEALLKQREEEAPRHNKCHEKIRKN